MKVLIDGQTFETPEIHRGIGVYTKNTINQMIKISYEHEWYIAVSNVRNLDELDPWVKSRLHVIVNNAFVPGSDYNRNQSYTEKMQEIVDQQNIDAVWIPNGLMVNVLFLSFRLSCPTFVTVYDLIPLLFPIKEWPKTITEEYKRRLQMLRDEQSIRLIMISESTLQDWATHMKDNNSEYVVTPLSADARIFYRKRVKDQYNETPYILFTGGFDYRKNIDGAINAFAQARKRHSSDEDFMKYKLVIVGKYNNETKMKYDKIISSKNLENQVELTGYVSDDKLAELYQNADLFFFPSLYEGFGLPILEAMLSGDYIICADNSSLPEVCGGHATLFSVNDPKEMAEALYQGYCAHKNETQNDIDRRQEYALGFSWDLTAKGTLEMIEKSTFPDKTTNSKPALAIFTPWPDQETGIANYENKLTPSLSNYFDITIFTTANVKNDTTQKIKVMQLKSFQDQKNQFDYKLFQIGNNVEFHKEIFELLEKVGGIAEIHDYILTPFFWCAYRKNPSRFDELLKIGYGEERGGYFSSISRQIHNHPDIYECPMSETVAALADKTIFHNHWSAEQLQQKNVYIIPLPSFAMETPKDASQQKNEEKFCNKFGIKKGDYLISCFGWVNTNKRPNILIHAIQALMKQGYKIKLVFWGKNNVDSLPGIIQDSELADSVFISGYLSSDEYYTALQMTDIVINLRYPSMGEASGTLCEAFQMAKPTIVSAINQYNEYPDEVCWKLPVCEQETELLSQYIAYLIDHPDVREAMGQNAKAYAEYALNPERIAKLYYDYITQGG